MPRSLSLELGSVGKDFTNLERPMKHDFKTGGTLVEASRSLKSPHCRILTLVAGVSERHWSRRLHQRSSVTSFAYLRSVVHFWA